MSTISIKELSHPAGEVIKIAAGKTLDLKTQGSVTMPAGSVIQVVQTYNPNSIAFASTSTSWVPSGFIATITPKYIGSKILVNWSNTMSQSDGNGQAAMYIYDGGWAAMAGSSNFHLGYRSLTAGGLVYGPHVFNGNVVTTDLDALSFQPYVKSNSNTFNFVHNQSSYALTLTEVAQ
mgnify:CR=1 FL=1